MSEQLPKPANGTGPTQTSPSPDARSAGQVADDVHSDLMEKIAKSKLKEDRKQVLRNLTSRDFVLGCLTENQVEEFKYKLEIRKEQFFGLQPHENCEVTGEIRAWVNDDPSDTLEPMTPTERLEVKQFFDGVYNRITRARKGWQQEMFNKQIQEQTVRREDTTEDGDGGGLLSRWR